VVVADVFEQKSRWTFINFLEKLARRYRGGPVHCILDNASYHYTAQVQDWLRRHPRFEFHFTPTHASWINQVEVWFSIVGRKVLARGDFTSRARLRDALLSFTAHWNETAHPFNWKWGADLLEDSTDLRTRRSQA
jgi:transposase